MNSKISLILLASLGIAVAGCASLPQGDVALHDLGSESGFKVGRVHYGGDPEVVKPICAQLKLRTDLDLRVPEECTNPERSVLGVTLIRARVGQGLELFGKEKRAAWTQALRTFSDSRNYPIYFHGGNAVESTEMLAFLLQGLCGAPEGNLRADWVKRFKAFPGAAFKDKIAAFAERNLGLTRIEIAAIRENLTAEKLNGDVPSVLVEYRKSKEHPRNSEGDVIKLRNGHLLLVFSHFYHDAKSQYKGGAHDHSSAEIVLSESADGGKSWSPLRTVVRKAEGTLNVMSASFLRLDENRIALFYCAKNSTTDCRPLMMVSHDEGLTWSKPVRCVADEEIGYYVMNNARAYRLASTGRILVPLACHDYKGKNSNYKVRNFNDFAIICCAISDDDGKTWHLSADRKLWPGAGKQAELKGVALQEPGLIELKDGRLMMYARSSERRQWRFFSKDGGEHWTDAEPITEYGTTTFSPVTYARLKDGRLVVVFNDATAQPRAAVRYERRWPLTIGVSSDEGKTWSTKLIEADDPSVWVHACYIAVREIDGRLILVYCYCDGLASTRVSSIPLTWLP